MLTQAQLATLKTAIMAETDPTFVQYRTNGQTPLMRDWFNSPAVPAFLVRRTYVESSEVGPVLNYVAVSNLTTANRDRATTFLALNQAGFKPTADVESYWDTTFGGTLGGEGANTRTALQNLWRRQATRGERLFATGTGTQLSPGTLVFEGDITDTDIGRALAL